MRVGIVLTTASPLTVRYSKKVPDLQIHITGVFTLSRRKRWMLKRHARQNFTELHRCHYVGFVVQWGPMMSHNSLLISSRSNWSLLRSLEDLINDCMVSVIRNIVVMRQVNYLKVTMGSKMSGLESIIVFSLDDSRFVLCSSSRDLLCYQHVIALSGDIFSQSRNDVSPLNASSAGAHTNPGLSRSFRSSVSKSRKTSSRYCPVFFLSLRWRMYRGSLIFRPPR